MSENRVGSGFDIHPLVAGRKLILGGVEIDFEKGLEGHSDADVLLHAICDALLGAAALGDIGQHFPPDDPQYKDADSAELLRQVHEKIRTEGWTNIENIDVTVMAERPRIGVYVKRIRERIAAVLSIKPERVNIKATTAESLGFVGRGEGIAASAVCLISRDE